MKISFSAVGFKEYSVVELLTAHSAVLSELRRCQVIRSANNPTGDYAEWLVVTKLGLTLVPQSVKGYDAVDMDGGLY